MNLLKETIEVLQENGKGVADILWCGSADGKYAIGWDEFAKIANIDYDEGYGGNEIVSDLVIVGEDFWLTRGEYNGSEWWNFNTIPIKKPLNKSFSKVKCDKWKYSLDSLNGGVK